MAGNTPITSLLEGDCTPLQAMVTQSPEFSTTAGVTITLVVAGKRGSLAQALPGDNHIELPEVIARDTKIEKQKTKN